MGHSYIARLEAHLISTTQQLRAGSRDVKFVSKAGARVDDLRQLAANLSYRHVTAAHLEIGGNDLSTQHAIVPDVVDAIVKLARWLLDQGVERIVVGEMLHRTRSARRMGVSVTTYNARVDAANQLMKKAARGQAGLIYRPHRLLHGQVGRDGVHLTTVGINNLWRSVCRGAAD